MTDQLIDAVARAMEKFFSGADIAYGAHLKAARVALKAIENSGTHLVVPAWKPIETAPMDGTSFVFTNGEYVGMGRYVSLNAFGADSWGGVKDTTPTHWMPLPSPPRENNP